ncbi:MAG: glycogen/starch/alpha-glucan phosphorylase, partial [Oscillospiraceae bacterium]
KSIKMANLALGVAHTVNGVAKIHTQILKDTVIKEWYKMYPNHFQNKTNGITQRRWLGLCNKPLCDELKKLGCGDFIKNLENIKKLNEYKDDEKVLDRLYEIKQQNKQILADYILKKEGIVLKTDFIFDIQVKRLHEYKRQLLNALSILDIYYGIKNGKIKDFQKTAFIFGAKAAPSYRRAKGIIKFINEIAKLINNDKDVNDKMQVIFVTDYNVSYAEKLIPAANVSEQISTAGPEASGTGNMKFMLNGAVTLGTYDGANVEIVEQAGLENNYIFGAKVEQLNKIRSTYNPVELCKKNKRFSRVLETLINGTFSDGGDGSFAELYDSIMIGASWHKPDNYFLLYDFEDYVNKKLQLNSDYKNKREFSKKCLLNIANSSIFSSDRTVSEYAKDIWHV